jgi:hypothetical protein
MYVTIDSANLRAMANLIGESGEPVKQPLPDFSVGHNS